MRRSRIIFWGSLLIIILMASPLILKLPAIIPIFDLSSSASLGTAISGLTTPIISIISIILIYLAFIKQSEANGELRKQNELIREQSQIDIIFKMLDYINRDIDSFTYSSGETKLTGKLALLKLRDMIELFGSGENHANLSDHEFGQTAILIAGSYILLFEEIERSNLTNDKKIALHNKVKLHFKSYTSVAFFGAWLAYRKVPKFFDEESKMILSLVEYVFSEEDRKAIMIRGGIID